MAVPSYWTQLFFVLNSPNSPCYGTGCLPQLPLRLRAAMHPFPGALFHVLLRRRRPLALLPLPVANPYERQPSCSEVAWASALPVVAMAVSSCWCCVFHIGSTLALGRSSQGGPRLVSFL